MRVKHQIHCTNVEELQTTPHAQRGFKIESIMGEGVRNLENGEFLKWENVEYFLPFFEILLFTEFNVLILKMGSNHPACAEGVQN